MALQQKLTHLLLTKFNTEVDFAPFPKRLETDWLTMRLALFSQYCLPSVAGQEGADFQWLVFFDEASPAWFKDSVSTLGSLVKPVYVRGPATDEVIAQKVAETGLVSSPHLITTRLDSDDSISKDHLATVQRAFRNQDREFVTFPFGLQSFRNHLYNVYWPSNPFLSLIERVDGTGRMTTVFCVAHDRLGQKHKIKKILRSPQWLQVLHGSNLANTLRGWPCIRSHRHPRFSVIWPESTEESVVSRIRCSSKALGARADRLMQKLGVLKTDLN
jgi:hypothetical protein